MSDLAHKTVTQKFIELYNKLKNEGALDDEQIYNVAIDLLESEITSNKAVKSEWSQQTAVKLKDAEVNLKDIFKE